MYGKLKMQLLAFYISYTPEIWPENNILGSILSLQVDKTPIITILQKLFSMCFP